MNSDMKNMFKFIFWKIRNILQASCVEILRWSNITLLSIPNNNMSLSGVCVLKGVSLACSWVLMGCPQMVALWGWDVVVGSNRTLHVQINE